GVPWLWRLRLRLRVDAGPGHSGAGRLAYSGCARSRRLRLDFQLVQAARLAPPREPGSGPVLSRHSPDSSRGRVLSKGEHDLPASRDVLLGARIAASYRAWEHSRRDTARLAHDRYGAPAGERTAAPVLRDFGAHCMDAEQQR